MKKNIIINVILLFIVYFLFSNQNIIINSTIFSSYLFISKVLPFFLPIFIISKLLINYNFPYYIAKIFKNNIYVYILVISFISGSPNNAILIRDLLNNNIIDKELANKYIKCSFFQNPLFLYTMLKTIFNHKLAIFIIISQILSNIIIYLIKPIKNNNIVKINSKRFNEVLINSINEIINILLYIYLTIVLFNIIIQLIPNNLNNFIGIFEITNGLNYLIGNGQNTIIKLILCIIYISFGGLAINLQIKSVLNDTLINYNNFLISRFYQIIIMFIILFLTYCFNYIYSIFILFMI